MPVIDNNIIFVFIFLFILFVFIFIFSVAKYRTTKALVSLKGSWTEQILLKEKLNIKEKMRNIKVKYKFLVSLFVSLFFIFNFFVSLLLPVCCTYFFFINFIWSYILFLCHFIFYFIFNNNIFTYFLIYRFLKRLGKGREEKKWN